MQLCAVEKVWQERADRVVLVSDQLWAFGKTQRALDEVVAFAASAATVVENLRTSTTFAAFARDRVRGIAGNAAISTAVVSHIYCGWDDGLETEALLNVLERLGFGGQT